MAHRGGAPKGKRHNKPGEGGVSRYTDRKGRLILQGRIRWEGKTVCAPAATVPPELVGEKRKRAVANAEREAKANLAAFVADLKAGKVLPAEKRDATLGQWLAVWEQDKKDALPKDTPSWSVHKSRIDNHVREQLSGVRIRDLDAERLLKWRRERRDAGVSDKTIRAAERLVRECLKAARVAKYPVQDGVLDVAPVAKPKTDPAATITEAQFRRLLAVAEEPWRTFYLVVFHTGCRVSEAMGLRWHRILWSANQIDVAEQRDRSGRFRAPKWDSAGVVSVPAELMDTLRAHRPTDAADDALVFPGRKGLGTNYDAVKHALHRHLDAAKLPRMGYHAFRHGSGTAWVAVDAPLLAIKQQLRHKNVRTTEGYLRPVADGSRHAENVAQRVRDAG